MNNWRPGHTGGPASRTAGPPCAFRFIQFAFRSVGRVAPRAPEGGRECLTPGRGTAYDVRRRPSGRRGSLLPVVSPRVSQQEYEMNRLSSRALRLMTLLLAFLLLPASPAFVLAQDATPAAGDAPHPAHIHSGTCAEL